MIPSVRQTPGGQDNMAGVSRIIWTLTMQIGLRRKLTDPRLRGDACYGICTLVVITNKYKLC